MLAILTLAGCANSSDPSSDNTHPYDTLYADVSGAYTLAFNTTAVNINDYPADSATGYLISGTLPKGPLELYTIYIYFEDSGDGRTEYDLAGTEGMTRFVFNAGLTGAETLGSNIAGHLTLTKNTDKEMSGTFSYSAATPDSSKSITISNGFFSFTIEN